MVAAQSPPEWFDITRYGGATQLDFQGWAEAIATRIHLDNLLTTSNLTAEQLNATRCEPEKPEITVLQAEQLGQEKLREFDEYFENLKTAPFYEIGFSSTNASDKSVFPIPFGVAKQMTDVLSDVGCTKNDSCDERLQEFYSEMYAGQAHLLVRLEYPKRLIVDHFKAWLDVALPRYRSTHPRSKEAVLGAHILQNLAINYPILPYQDLMLWYRRYGIKRPSYTVMSEWFALINGANNETVAEIAKWAKRTFTMSFYFELTALASDEA